MDSVANQTAWSCSGEFVTAADFLLPNLSYFAYGWNVVDVVITLLLTCYLAYKIQTYVGVASTEALSSEKIGHPDYFPPLAAKAGVPLEKAATIL
ncbi:hypothetical protein FOZ62_020907, partial [Perkinsus olseni]